MVIVFIMMELRRWRFLWMVFDVLVIIFDVNDVWLVL